MPSYAMTKNNYQYFNANPKGEEIEDCVTRAICTATGLKYDAVTNLLDLSAEQYSCEKLCVCCYHHLLENVLCYKPFYCVNGETVGDIAERLMDRRVIIRILGHLTTAIYGIVYDIWDCTYKKADVYWIVS